MNILILFLCCLLSIVFANIQAVPIEIALIVYTYGELSINSRTNLFGSIPSFSASDNIVDFANKFINANLYDSSTRISTYSQDSSNRIDLIKFMDYIQNLSNKNLLARKIKALDRQSFFNTYNSFNAIAAKVNTNGDPYKDLNHFSDLLEKDIQIRGDDWIIHMAKSYNVIIDNNLTPNGISNRNDAINKLKLVLSKFGASFDSNSKVTTYPKFDINVFQDNKNIMTFELSAHRIPRWYELKPDTTNHIMNLHQLSSAINTSKRC
jgi:hypothetical protein